MKQALLSALSVSLVCLLVACNKKETDPNGACDHGYGKFEMNTNVSPPRPYLVYAGVVPPVGEITYTFRLDSTAIFITAKKLSGICSKEHLELKYTTIQNTTADVFPVTGLKVYGEAVYGFASRRVDLKLGEHSSWWTGSLEVGLDQQFRDKPAIVDVYTTVEFKSLGSRALDSAFFVGWFKTLKAESDYSIH